MAEIVVTQDELALRRRARRRLVGAVAIALTSVLVLPMLFDSEPKPLGPEVEISIPEQNSPFEVAPAPTQPVQPAQPEAEAGQPEANMAEPSRSPAPAASKATAKATSTPAEVQPRPDTKPSAEATAKALPKPEAKTKPDAKSGSEAKPPQKPLLKPDSPFVSQGYFLQLGAFSSEVNARQLSDKATAAGFKVALVGANGQYRVRVGPIPQHQRALEMQARLKAKGFSPVLLGP